MREQMFLVGRAMMNRAANFAGVNVQSILPFLGEAETRKVMKVRFLITKQ